MVLGFDFMIDSSLNVYLIEVNTSPSNELSTPVTTPLIEKFQRDQAKLFFDYNMFAKPAERKVKVDLGGFKHVWREKEKKQNLRDLIAAKKESLPTEATNSVGVLQE